MTAQTKHVSEWAVIEAATRSQEGGPATFDVVCARFPDVPPKVIARKFEKMIARGFLDCGVSPVYAWATPESAWPRRPTGGPREPIV